MIEPTTVTQSFLTGLGPFLIYFILGLIFLGAFIVAYTAVTPHKELDLVKQNQSAAAVSFGGALIGFALPIAYLIAQAVSVLDFILWAITAGIVQLIAFFAFRIVFPKISSRIEMGEMAAPTALAALHIVVGMINAASLTY